VAVGGGTGSNLAGDRAGSAGTIVYEYGLTGTLLQLGCDYPPDKIRVTSGGEAINDPHRFDRKGFARAVCG
jgi:hypothetical protein